MRSVSISTLREILYDINNGVFSADYETNNKYYYDVEKDIDVEVQSKYNDLIGAWQFEVNLSDGGDEYTLEGGQWSKLYNALMGDIEWREKEARSEAEHIKHLWRAYA